MVWAIGQPFATMSRHDWNVSSSRPGMRVMYADCDCGNVFSMIAFAPATDCAAPDAFDWN